MADLLKEVYNSEFIENLSISTYKFDSNFNQKKFIKFLLNNSWYEKSLKERMRAISIALNKFLSPILISDKIEILKKTAIHLQKNKNSSLSFIIFPDFIEQFCDNNNFDLAINSLEFFTEFGSSEFAMRKFIEINQDEAFKYLEKFSKSKNFHVRRLASECCRPLLPWGKVLRKLKENPEPIFKILENLKFDREIYVKKSIANNLNDISKNNPDLVLKILESWKEQKVSEFIIKHSLRTLLKKGNSKALSLIGIENNKKEQNYIIKDFYLEKPQVNLNNYLNFGFDLENFKSNNKIRIEYAMFFLKKNGSLSKKIFQISTKNFEKGVFQLRKKHLFKNFTTRKHYFGEHFISLIVNGLEIDKIKFDLT